MSDMLSPLRWDPPTLPAPLQGAETPARAAAAGTTSARTATAGPVSSATDSRYAWPSPPYASFPAPQEQTAPLACEIEGVNGKLMRGRLIFFVPDQGVAHVQIPPARITMPLRFDQFRLLRLTDPLQADPILPGGQSDPHAAVLSHRPRSPFTLVYANGERLEGETVGHEQRPFGSFLFRPLADDNASVLREFVP